MGGPGHQFLASAAGAFDEQSAGSFGYAGEDGEELPHGRTAPHHVGKGVLAPQLLLQPFHLAQVLKGFHPADYAAPLIAQKGGRDPDGHPAPGVVDDKGVGPHHRLA